MAVGIDLGSCHARVAVRNAKGNGEVLSNTQGHRYTKALVATEPTEDDMEDGMGHNHHHESKKKKQQQQQQKQGPQYVFGDAAVRLNPLSVREELFKAMSTTEGTNENNDDEEKEETKNSSNDGDDDNDDVNGNDSLTASIAAEPKAFLGYICQLAADATAVPADQIRVVTAIPTPVDGSTDDTIGKVYGSAIAMSIKQLIGSKTKRKKFEGGCIGVLTEAAAVCVAHGLTDTANVGTASNHSILVLDGGASGLKITRFQSHGGVLVQQSHRLLEKVSGPAFLTLLGQHVAQQFERKHRFPLGEVWQSKKARAKLLKESERALLGSSANLTFTIDGLYEGMDCNVTVSKPRWEMMASNLLRQAQAALAEHQNIDTVLLAGTFTKPLLGPIVQKAFPQASRGDRDILPEEAIALGCTKQAAMVLDSMNNPDAVRPTPTLANVPACPVSIGTDDSVLIPHGAPLPFRVTTKPCTDLYQLTPSRIHIAKIEGVESAKQMILELSDVGELSITVDQQPTMTLA